MMRCCPSRAIASALVILALYGLAVAAGDRIFYDVTARNEVVSPDGFPRTGIVLYHNNGPSPKTPLFPGPTVYAKVGDELVFKITNEMYGLATTIYFHGLLGAPYYDGSEGITQCPILPLMSFEYKFQLTKSGTYWYHAHTSGQLPDGLFGAIVIYDDDQPQDIPWYDQDLVVMVHAWAHYTSTQMLPMFTSGVTDPVEAPVHSTLINGVGVYMPTSSEGNNYYFLESYCTRPLVDTDPAHFAVIQVNKDSKVRLRFINASPASHFIISIDNHNMTVIEMDGVLVKPYTVGSLSLDTGQRYSVIIDTTADGGDGNFWIRAGPALAEEHPTGYAILRYAGAPDSPPATNGEGYMRARDLLLKETLVLEPLVPSPPPPATRRIVLHAGPVENSPFYQVNGVIFRPTGMPVYQALVSNRLKQLDEHTQMIILDYNEVVDLVIINDDKSAKGFHPIHLHGHNFWVLGMGYSEADDLEKLNTVNPILRDTQQIPPGGWVVLRFIANNPGVWLLRNHVEWYYELGYGLVFIEAADRLPPLPESFPRCGSYSSDDDPFDSAVSKTTTPPSDAAERRRQLIPPVPMGANNWPQIQQPQQQPPQQQQQHPQQPQRQPQQQQPQQQTRGQRQTRQPDRPPQKQYRSQRYPHQVYAQNKNLF